MPRSCPIGARAARRACRSTAPGSRSGGIGERHARRHDGARRRVRREVRLAIDEATLEVRAAEFADTAVGDAPMLPGLPSRSPEGEPTASVTADGAHDGRACRDAIAARGAGAIVPPRRDARPWKEDGPGARGRSDDLRAMKRFGRTLRRKGSGHHRRSRVEARMNRMRQPGRRLAARDFDRRTAELQARIAILNRSTALAIPVTQPVGRRRTGKRKPPAPS